MTKDQLTALAREYAEEYTKKKYPNAPGHVRERIVEGRLEHMEDFIPWLLRRFCLVEKSKVEDIHKGILVQLDPKNFGYSPYNQVRIDLLKSLFPDLGKEVES